MLFHDTCTPVTCRRKNYFLATVTVRSRPASRHRGCQVCSFPAELGYVFGTGKIFCPQVGEKDIARQQQTVLKPRSDTCSGNRRLGI